MAPMGMSSIFSLSDKGIGDDLLLLVDAKCQGAPMFPGSPECGFGQTASFPDHRHFTILIRVFQGAIHHNIP